MQVHRLQSPFKHWVRGLLAELLAFGAFILFVSVVVAALVRIF